MHKIGTVLIGPNKLRNIMMLNLVISQICDR